MSTNLQQIDRQSLLAELSLLREIGRFESLYRTSHGMSGGDDLEIMQNEYDKRFGKLPDLGMSDQLNRAARYVHIYALLYPSEPNALSGELAPQLIDLVNLVTWGFRDASLDETSTALSAVTQTMFFMGRDYEKSLPASFDWQLSDDRFSYARALSGNDSVAYIRSQDISSPLSLWEASLVNELGWYVHGTKEQAICSIEGRLRRISHLLGKSLHFTGHDSLDLDMELYESFSQPLYQKDGEL